MIQISIQDKTPELMQKLEAAAGRFVRKAAFHIEGQMKLSMAEEKTGNEYERGPKAIEQGKKAKHRASAPGESPAVDSSNLTNSISILPMTHALEAKIGTPVEYALPLETGTKHMEARPLWERTVNEALPTLEALLKQEINRA